MKQFISPNPAYNMSVAAAKEFVAKLKSVGIHAIEILLDANDNTGFATSYWPLYQAKDIEGYDESVPVNCLLSFGYNDHRNARMLLAMADNWSQHGYRRVFTECYPGRDVNSALLALPGVSRAIDKALKG